MALALPLNALAMGFVGSFAARGAWTLLGRLHPASALFLAGWLSIVLPALLVALAGMCAQVLGHAQVRPTPVQVLFNLGWMGFAARDEEPGLRELGPPRRR